MEKQKLHDSTVVILLPGALSPAISMLPIQIYLKRHGFKNTTTISLHWSIEKFDKLVEYAVGGITRQVEDYKKRHEGNDPRDLVLIGFSNGGSVGAKALEIIKDKGLATNPKLITLATPARNGEKHHSVPVRAALSLTDSYRHKPDVTFPKKWISVYSTGDHVVNPQRTFADENGNEPQELVATKQALSHLQILDPRKTGPIITNLLARITQ